MKLIKNYINDINDINDIDISDFEFPYRGSSIALMFLWVIIILT